MNLQAVLGGAVAANQPEAHVVYVTWNVDGKPSKPAQSRTALNSNTDVNILTAPGINGHVREPIRISIYNKDTASVLLIVKTDDGTERIIIRQTLLTLESLHWEKGSGWQVLGP